MFAKQLKFFPVSLISTFACTCLFSESSFAAKALSTFDRANIFLAVSNPQKANETFKSAVLFARNNCNLDSHGCDAVAKLEWNYGSKELAFKFWNLSCNEEKKYAWQDSTSCWLIKKMKAPADSAKIDSLLNSLKAEGPRTTWNNLLELAQYGNPKTLDFFKSLVNDKDENRRHVSLRALGHIGSQAFAVLLDQINQAGDSDFAQLQAALETIVHNAETPSEIDALSKQLNSVSPAKKNWKSAIENLKSHLNQLSSMSSKLTETKALLAKSLKELPPYNGNGNGTGTVQQEANVPRWQFNDGGFESTQKFQEAWPKDKGEIENKALSQWAQGLKSMNLFSRIEGSIQSHKYYTGSGMLKITLNKKSPTARISQNLSFDEKTPNTFYFDTVMLTPAAVKITVFYLEGNNSKAKNILQTIELPAKIESKRHAVSLKKLDYKNKTVGRFNGDLGLEFQILDPQQTCEVLLDNLINTLE